MNPTQVAALRKLLSKSNPSVERLFQRAKPGVRHDSENTWFAKSPLGHVVFQAMLPRISEAAGLFKKYTNHSIRATSVTVVKAAGFDDKEVCHVTGHKNPASLNSYSKPTEKDCKAMAAALDATKTTAEIAVAGPSSRLAREKLEGSETASFRPLCFDRKGSIFTNLTITVCQPGSAAIESKQSLQQNSGMPPATSQCLLGKDSYRLILCGPYPC